MALVRCPKHDIPYNDDNPRGCPACAQERAGTDRSAVMRDLARASQTARRPGGAETTGDRAAPVTTPPRPPATLMTGIDRLQRLARERPAATFGIPIGVALLAILLLRSGPAFVDQPSPPRVTTDVRPLPIAAGAPISTAFAVLGVQPPGPSPIASSLERYAYGQELSIDALNGIIYQITIALPNRTWQGLQVGMSERRAEGTLALLAEPQRGESPTSPRADTLGGYVVYASLDARPRRSLKAEVRPPNGCYDVMVDLQPRAAGILVQGGRRYAAVGRPGASLEWVVTHIRVLDRSVPGPQERTAACR